MIHKVVLYDTCIFNIQSKKNNISALNKKILHF